MTDQTICDLVRKAETNYINGTTTISEHVQFSQWENINKIDAYLNSKFTSGDKDTMGREKPFFNIVTAACNIWWRATDIDRKDIRFKAGKKRNFVGAFVATLLLQDWMKRSAFGQFLNDWGRSLARYGSSVLKFVEKDGELYPEVVSWQRLISDTVNFGPNPKIERLYLTPAELKANKSYDQDMVKELLDAQLVTRKTLNNQIRDNKADYIEVFEVHGNLPLYFLTDNEDDEDEFVQQMHVVSFVGKKTGRAKSEYEDFTLYKGRESKDPYMITHLIKEDGRSQSIGAVEYLFDAQWMQNHTAKAIKDQLDLASKLIFQTSDGTYVGRNALTSIESGDILIHAMNQPLTQINNNSHDVASLQNFGLQWKQLAQEITNTPDILGGKTQPSGTAFRLGAILQQESHSLFEVMTENKGLAIEEMSRKYIIPFFKKKIDTTEEISTLLSNEQITQLDSMFLPNEVIRRVNQQIVNSALNGRIVNSIDPKQEADRITAELAQLGNQRFIKPSDIPTKTWKEVLKDLEWEIEVEVTNEQNDKEAVLTTLTSVLQTIAGNPAVLQDPTMKALFVKILDTAGAISPLEIAQVSAPRPSQPVINPEEVSQPPNNIGGGVGERPAVNQKINQPVR